MWFSSGRARASALGAFVLLVLAGPSIAADKPAGQSDPIARHGFADSDVGYVLRDLKTGATIASHLPDRTFIPASVAKVGTSVAALETLGPEHRFVTRLLVDGTVDRKSTRLNSSQSSATRMPSSH